MKALFSIEIPDSVDILIVGSQTNLENTPFKLIIHKNKKAIGSFSGQIKNSSQKNYKQLITEMKYD